MIEYRFNAKDRNLEDFFYAYSPAPKVHREFDLREDCVANFAGDDIENFDYVSIITKKKYKGRVKISTRCRFDKFGAPLIIFTNDINHTPDGKHIYGLHFECVAYEGGCNMWRIVPAPERVERPIATAKIAFTDFQIPEGSIIDMSLEISGKTMTACVNGETLVCTHPDIPEEFHVGITACEGPNLFYDLTIEEES